MLRIALAILALQDPDIAIVNVSPKFLDGVHFACEASFEVVLQDTSYFRGQRVGAVGSVSFNNWPDQSHLSVGMKLGIYAKENGGWMPPTNAYLVNGYRTNLQEQQANIEADSPNFRIFVFDVEGTETINSLLRIATEGRLDVAYTIGDGSMPTTFPVMFSSAQSEEWLDCISALARRDQGLAQ